MQSAGRVFLLSLAPLAVVCAGMFWIFVQRLDLTADRALEHRARVTAAVIRRAVEPGVDFLKKEDVLELLQPLREAPDLEYAVVLLQDGSVLAGLDPDRRPDVMSRPAEGPALRWTRNALHIAQPIETKGGLRATLAIGFSLNALHAERRTTLGVIGLAAALVLLGGGVLMWLLAHFVDRRRAAEEAQRRSEESFRLLIEALPDAVVMERGGAVVYANPAAVRSLGLASGADLHGQSAGDLLVVDEAHRRSLSLRTMHEAGQPLHLPDVQLTRRDGSHLAADVLILPLNLGGAPAGVLIAREVTERKVIQAQLVHNDRMATMGTIAAGIAHEINNPMAYVMTNLTFALDAVGPGPMRSSGAELRQALAEAIEGAERVRHIVSSLKAYSRVEEESVAPVDVERALDAAVNMARAEIRGRAELERARGGVPAVLAQESRLVQVFVNLLINAAQAIPMGVGGRHVIGIRTLLDDEGRVVVRISDTGAGIPPENLGRLFDPFFTTKPVGVGTGLGLWICRDIVQGIGGEIRVASKVGEGSRFEVVLRASRVAAVPLPPTPSAAARMRSDAAAMPRMLVVDDEPRIGQSLARLFARELRVVSETSAPKALERLRLDPGFDVVICDLMMPEMSGVELYRAIRHFSPPLAERVVFLTGGAFTPDAAAFLESVSNPVVEKPFDGDHLRGVIDEILERRRSGPIPSVR